MIKTYKLNLPYFTGTKNITMMSLKTAYIIGYDD